MSLNNTPASAYVTCTITMAGCENEYPRVNSGLHQKAYKAHKILLLLLLFMSSASSEAASARDKIALRKGCQAGLLQGDKLETEKDAALDSFLSLSLTPLSTLKEEVWLRVRLLDVYSRPVYLLELSQSADVGCWLSLRHVQSGEIIAKVLWPRDVLQSFKETLITMVLRDGVLRVTAVRMRTGTGPYAEVHPLPTTAAPSPPSPPPRVAGVLKAPNRDDTDDLRSGPYLMLATLRRVHESWQEPHAVSLQMMSDSSTLYYAMNCATDDLQWAWMDVLGVHTHTAAVWVPWVLVMVAAVVVVIVVAEIRWQWCRRLGQICKTCCLEKGSKDGKPDEHSRISSLAEPTLGLSAPSVTLGKVSSRAPSPGLDLAAGEIRDDDKKAYTNYAYE